MENQNDFFDFLKKFGVKEATFEQLGKERICSLKQLASTKPEDLNKITNDAVLVNTIHPILNKHDMQIAIASNPDEKALTLFDKAAAMNTSSPADDLQSDAIRSGADTRKNQATQCKPRNETNITITDGNFPQTAIACPGEVIYNNTNTTLQTMSYVDSQEVRDELRKQKIEPSRIKDKDKIFSTSEFFLRGFPDYWMDQFEVKKCNPQTAEQLRTESDIYPVNPWNSNQALIINMTKFSDNKTSREGGNVDKELLQKILSQLGFSITVCENKKKSEVEESLREFIKMIKQKPPSITLVFIGSHGGRYKNKQGDMDDLFMTSDRQLMSAADVMNLFNGTNCPQLIRKPKLFLFQFCRTKRGTATIEGISGSDDDEIEENLPPVPHNAAYDTADMMWTFASAAGTKSYRDTNVGSWFVTALCIVLKEYAHSEHLLDMMTRVNNMLRYKKGKDQQGEDCVQLSEVHQTLHKKVRFFPLGDTEEQ